MPIIYSHLVWLGANTAREPADILNTANNISLFEARETACKKLQQKFPQDNVSVIQALLTATQSNVNFTEYNLAEFSAIQKATGLKNLFPGIKAVNSEPMTGTAISDAINALNLLDDNNLLIIDVLDNNLALLTALETTKQLHLFRTISIQSALEPPYENAATNEDVINYLQTQGYVLQQTTGNDPDLPWLSFGLNPLWASLQEAQQSNNALNAELTKLRQTVEQQIAEQKQKLETAIAQATASKQELQKQEARVNEINSVLATANKAKQDAEQQLAAIKQQLTTAQQELATSKQSAEQIKLEQKQQLETAIKAKQDVEQQLAGIKQQLTTAQQELTKAQQDLAQTKAQAQQQQTESNVQQALEQKLQKMFADQAQQLTKEVGNIKNHINTGLANTSKQLEAFVGIQNYLEKGIKPLSFHGWPISPDIGLYITGLIDTNNYDVIIEFGSGTSTVLMAKALISKQRGVQTKALANTSQSNEVAVQDQTFTDLPARIVTFEHNSLYHGKTTQALKDNNVEYLVDLVHAPLVDYEDKDGNQYLYYNCNEKLQELANIFKGRKANILVLVDGPPGVTNKNARFPALPHLLNSLPEHSLTIIMDDYKRPDEKSTVDEWELICRKRFIEYQKEEIACEKGMLLMKIS